MMIPSISISELLHMNFHGNLIDLRSTQNYNNNHIPGAIHIPFETLLAKAKQLLDPNETYYIYCQKGTKSIRVCQILNQMGYHTVNVAGGYESWILEK